MRKRKERKERKAGIITPSTVTVSLNPTSFVYLINSSALQSFFANSFGLDKCTLLGRKKVQIAYHQF